MGGCKGQSMFQHNVTTDQNLKPGFKEQMQFLSSAFFWHSVYGHWVPSEEEIRVVQHNKGKITTTSPQYFTFIYNFLSQKMIIKEMRVQQQFHVSTGSIFLSKCPQHRKVEYFPNLGKIILLFQKRNGSLLQIN